MFPQGWQLGLAGIWVVVEVLTGTLGNSRAFAQIIPDNSLGNYPGDKPSTVSSFPFDPSLKWISGGAIRGSNLFHSFREFNIETGQSAFFTSSAGIQNILARVTGSNPSMILGTLGAFGSSNPNLFLINPNGIIFGRDARLAVAGSFVATTANAIAFGDRGFFSASTRDVPSPLLTVKPSAFFFNQPTPGSITNQSVATFFRDSLIGLRVGEGKSLLLVGGNVNLDGGVLQAPEGRIELGGIAGPGTVGLNVDGNNLSLKFPDRTARADISLTQGARVVTSGSGNIQVFGRRVTLTDGSQMVANNLGAKPGGTLTVNASESVELKGTASDGRFSGLFTQTRGSGRAGTLTIETGRLMLQDGAQISAGTFGKGAGGTLTVTASESVELKGTTPDGQLRTGLFTQAEAAGDAGDLTLETRRLIVQDGAAVSTRTANNGQGGTLTVRASESVELRGTTPNGQFSSGLFTQTTGGSGAAGDLMIDTGRLIVRDGAVVSASTFREAQGRGGLLMINASESVELLGTSANGQLRSGLLVGTAGIAPAGNLTLKTRRVVVQDGAVVSAGSSGPGEGGRLTVTASESIELLGTSADRRFVSSLQTQALGTGLAGDLNIETGQLIVRDGAKVTVSSEGLGDAGNLEVKARSITLDNHATLSATTKSGNGGDMTLRVQDLLLLRNNSNISTTAGTAQAGGNGGNIDIDTQFLVAVPSENSDITANAFQGNGGNIQIAAQGIFGIQFRVKETPQSDITASSELGVDGVVEINTPDVDPSRGLVALPTEVVDASRLIASGCGTPQRIAQSEFIVTGRGGLPPSPSDPLSDDAVWSDLRSFSQQAENPSSAAVVTQANHPPSRQLVEAQGWMFNDKGQVVLTAQSPTVTPHSSWQAATDCGKL